MNYNTSPSLWKRSPLAVAVATAMTLTTSPQLMAEETIESILVVGDPTEVNNSYLADDSSVANKLNSDLMEVSRSVSIVTREQLNDRNVQSIGEALRYSAGIVASPFGEDNKQDWFRIRGFSQANFGLFQDGTRVPSLDFYSWQIEPFGVDRVEVMKGPASVLYGQNPPGGLIHLVSKRPTADARHSVGVQFGSDDLVQLNGDFSGPISDSVRYRVVGLTESANSQVEHVESDRLFFAPSLEIDFGENTEVTLLSNFQKDNSVPYLQFHFPDGTLHSTANGYIDTSTYVGEPGQETFKRTQYTLGYELNHSFNETWDFQQNMRFAKQDLTVLQYWSTLVLGQNGRGVTYHDGDSTSWTLDNRIVGNWQFGEHELTALFGTDYQQLDISDDTPASSFVFGGFFDPFNPVYGFKADLGDTKHTNTEMEQMGFYVQLQAKLFDRLILNGGIRYDENDTSNTVTEPATDAATATSSIVAVEDQESTYSMGILYEFDSGVSPYYSYSEFFKPIPQLNFYDQAYIPESGQQHEIGVKFKPQMDDLNALFTVSLFDITQENVRTPDPNEPQNRVQTGEVQSQGAEFEAVVEVAKNLQMLFAYTYIDMEITETNYEDRLGKTPNSQPENTASLWFDYNVNSGPIAGLGIGSGVRYVGSSYGDDTNTPGNVVPSYTLYDAMLSYRWDDIKLQLNVDNLTDEEFIASCNFNCFYGNRRRAILSLDYNW